MKSIWNYGKIIEKLKGISYWKKFICEENEINPIKFLKNIANWPKDTFYITDVGQHQMWAAQSLFIKKMIDLTSGGMGRWGLDCLLL